MCVCVAYLLKCVLYSNFLSIFSGEIQKGVKRNLLEEEQNNETPVNSSYLILAAKRTHRRDPLDDFKKYSGGWNISEKHYWAVSRYAFSNFEFCSLERMLFPHLLVFDCKTLVLWICTQVGRRHVLLFNYPIMSVTWEHFNIIDQYVWIVLYYILKIYIVYCVTFEFVCASHNHMWATFPCWMNLYVT